MNTNDIKLIFDLKQEVKDLNKKLAEHIKIENTLKKENKELLISRTNDRHRIKVLEDKIEKMKTDQDRIVKDAVEKAVKETTIKLTKLFNEELEKVNEKLHKYETMFKIDSSNSGTPTSKVSINKYKPQNNREKSDKLKGGQENHVIHKLEYFKEEEITKTIEYQLSECPKCGSSLEEKNIVIADQIEINVTVERIRNNIHNYYCKCCHKNITANSELPRGVTYGSSVNAMALSMMNETNASLNKTVSFIEGISNKEISLSEGYLCKLQKKCSNFLDDFLKQLKTKILSEKRLFWDDTTCKFGIDKPSEGFDEKDIKYLEEHSNDKENSKVRQGIIRFYGNDKLALIIGHRNKDKDSIDADNILPLLPRTCVLMHDHVLLNYNEEYEFQNAECNEHVRRYLKKNMECFPNHTWAKEMRDLLINIKKEKDELLENKIQKFPDLKLEEISNKYDDILKKAKNENDGVTIEYNYDKNDEKNLIERLEKFKINHLLFAYDFSVDFTNNTSERGIRQVKRKIAVSFMFKNANRMKDYAKIISYFETCFRNGITRYDAAKRLVSGSPFTLDEILNKEIITNK